MCRLAIYMGPELRMSHFLTEPDHSIIKQSVHANEVVVQLNGDGFGIAWYATNVSPHPAVFKEITPAWSNDNLRHLARVTSSNCILAHVRKATSSVVITNSHPFAHQQFSFMHNGFIAHFGKVKKTLVDMLSEKAFGIIKGTTDSEFMFGLFLDYYEQIESTKGNTNKLDCMAEAICKVIFTIEDITKHLRKGKDNEEPCNYLNLVVTDGNNLVASRYMSPEVDNPDDLKKAHTLFYSTGSEFWLHESGSTHVTRTEAPHADHEEGTFKTHEKMVIVSSEPLTNNKEDFVEVPPNHIVLGTRDSIAVKSLEKLQDQQCDACGARNVVVECSCEGEAP